MKRIVSLAICLLILLCVIAPPAAFARESEQKVVRVGWYESTYCYRDSFGERRGIAYEYQRRIAAHTGWTYEYVEDSWPNLLQMLINGEIDLMSDVSYTEERAQLMLYPAYAMGAESYYLYIDADNAEIDAMHPQSLNGKRIGVNKGSYQVGLLRDWAARNGVSPEFVELSAEESESLAMLAQGRIDAYATLDSFFEDVPDAVGNQRQFQTTKLKYKDTSGRLCLLGICQDVTDMVRIQHESAMTKEAYENAVSSGLMYTHIAQTLARDYTDLFCVNCNTEEYVQYRMGGDGGSMSETLRGWHFFSDFRTELGIRADTASGGEEALRMIEVQQAKHEPYNLVLVDWNMPGMNGLEASAEIQKLPGGGNSAVVVMTAYNWDDIQDEAKRVGVNSFLSKPLMASNAIEQIERIARRNNMDLFREKKSAPLAGRHILLAEDMEINAEIMIDMLEIEQITVDYAENGKRAVEMFQNNAPGTYDAILMDVRMPEMDGLEATEAIRATEREDAKRIPIIALTANAFDEDVQRSLQAGMNAPLNKPVDADRLLRTLGELIYEAENPA